MILQFKWTQLRRTRLGSVGRVKAREFDTVDNEYSANRSSPVGHRDVRYSVFASRKLIWEWNQVEGEQPYYHYEVFI
jgi:hypothetical protein